MRFKKQRHRYKCKFFRLLKDLHPLAWLLPEHENRQPSKVIRYPAHGGIKKVRTFNTDSGGRNDGIVKNA
jgi:hypothetical protein